MRILVVHAWLKGNLGDVLQLSVLLEALRALQPAALDLAGYPSPAAPAAGELLRIADRSVADPFWGWWKFSPHPVQSRFIEPRWKAVRRPLLEAYDAIVCAPGPYLASYDPRAAGALCDIRLARELRRPIILAGHSIGPLDSDALQAIKDATLRIAREPSTHDYLRAQGIESHLAADYAFLYPFEAVAASPNPEAMPHTLVFLRSNNLRRRSLRRVGNRLYHGDHLIADGGDVPLMLATSDDRRDRAFLEAAGRRLGVPVTICRTVAELVRLIAAASRVVSDRYHPAICAAVLGKPAQVLPNREPHKMQGLEHLLSQRTLAELQALARAGLTRVQEAVQASA